MIEFPYFSPPPDPFWTRFGPASDPLRTPIWTLSNATNYVPTTSDPLRTPIWTPFRPTNYVSTTKDPPRTHHQGPTTSPRTTKDPPPGPNSRPNLRHPPPQKKKKNEPQNEPLQGNQHHGPTASTHNLQRPKLTTQTNRPKSTTQTTPSLARASDAPAPAGLRTTFPYPG